MRSVLRAGLFVSATLLASLVAYADDYEGGEVGDQIEPINSQAIRMQRERVDIFVAWPKGESAHVPVNVIAEFVLVNTSADPQKIKVAFPAAGERGLDGFSRSVDGKEVEVKEFKAKKSQ